jgi:Glycine zipper
VAWRKWAESRRSWSSLFEVAVQPCVACEVQSANELDFMNTKRFTVVALVGIGSFILNSCETPTGFGAATGAIIGGAATGNVRGAALGAAAGAAAGTLTAVAIQESQAARYGPPPPGGFPFARWAGTPGIYYSPYTGRVYNLRGVPPGGLTRDVDTDQLFRRP